MSSLEQRIEEILTGVYATGHDTVEAAQAYAANFQSEGERKARFVINRIERFDAYTRDSLSNYLAVSVGGADASDLLALVRHTPIKHTILLEYDSDAAAYATKYSKPLIEEAGGSLRVIIGDAGQQLEKLVGLAEEAKGKGTVGLLCLCFGVLHELPRRSPGFELRHYFSRLTSVFDRNLLFLSEPCLPTCDQAEMELRVSTIKEDRLFELLRHINAHLFNNQQPNRMLSKGFVRAGFPLIMETLHKLLRYDSIPRFRHEMEERLTQFTPGQFLEILRIALPGVELECNELTTEGFRQSYQGADVALRTLDGEMRGMPFSHVQITAISLPTAAQLGIGAFNNALSVDKFQFRVEQVYEKSVEGTLEAKNDNNFTNCRAQVQLKSTDDTSRNADGSVSYQVDVSNVQSLLNGPSPLYVLYVAPRNELRFAWAHDERRRLDQERPKWQGQGEVTIRFCDVLTPDRLPEIHTRIYQEARLNRRIHETLVRTTEAEQVTVRIDKETLASTDPKEVKERLLKSGTSIVAAGFAQEASDLFDMLDSQTKRDPRLLMVKAYAMFSLDRCDAALGYLREARIGLTSLSVEDKWFLEDLSLSCDFRLGRISKADYLAKEEQLGNDRPGVFGLLNRLEVLRQRHLAERDHDTRRRLRDELNQLVAEVEKTHTNHQIAVISARITKSYAQGQDIVLEHVRNTGMIAMTMMTGHDAKEDLRNEYDRFSLEWKAWLKAMEELRTQAEGMMHPVLLADALYVRSAVLEHYFVNVRALSRKPLSTELTDTARSTMQDVEQAMEIFKALGCLEAELRARVLLADLFEVTGHESAAIALAQGVLPIAEAMGYDQIADNAKRHVDRQTPMAILLRQLDAEADRDDDSILAGYSPEELERHCEVIVEAHRVPKDRTPNVVEDTRAMQAAAQERLSWCQHLAVLSRKEHEKSPETLYREVPPHICVCTLHGYESAEGTTDWRRLIAAFKQDFCAACKDRAPKKVPFT